MVFKKVGRGRKYKNGLTSFNYYKYVDVDFTDDGAPLNNETEGGRYRQIRCTGINDLNDPPEGMIYQAPFWNKWQIMGVKVHMTFMRTDGTEFEPNVVAYITAGTEEEKQAEEFPSGADSGTLTLPIIGARNRYEAALAGRKTHTKMMQNSSVGTGRTIMKFIKPWEALNITRRTYMTDEKYFGAIELVSEAGVGAFNLVNPPAAATSGGSGIIESGWWYNQAFTGNGPQEPYSGTFIVKRRYEYLVRFFGKRHTIPTGPGLVIKEEDQP